jgi:nicotinamidase/pyrazinamidase
VQNTHGARLTPGLHGSRILRVFPKGTDPLIDSYSGFFDNGHLKSTGLGEFLSSKGVHDCYILGLATDYCVKFTALDARACDFNTYLVLDGCRGVELTVGDVEESIEEMAKAGVKVIYSHEVAEE